jgi:tRNA(Ile)-lysidine synthase
LLCLTREETAGVCRVRGLEPRTDPSNADPAFLRNRIRHQLLPTLESYSPAIRRLLVQTAQLMAAHDRLLELATERGSEKCLAALAVGTLWIDRVEFAKLPDAVQHGVAREALSRSLGGREDIAYRHVIGLAHFVANPPHSGHAHLMKTVHIYSAGPRLYLTRESDAPRAAPPSPLRVEAVPGRIAALSFGASVELDLAAPPPAAERRTDPWSAWIDFDRVHMPLYLRAAAPADRILPLGAPNEMRLSDFLARQHVPRFLRRIQPVLADDVRVVWVPGVRIHHAVRLTDHSQRALRLRWITGRT